MSEFPEDIMKDAEEAVAGFMGWIKGGNTTASLSEHAVAGLKHSFASAILAERERCSIEPAGVGVETVVRELDDKAACLREIIRHAKAEGNRYCEDEFGAPYIVNDRAEAAEAALQTAIYRLCVIQDSPNLTDGEKALLTSWVNDLRASLKGDEQ